MVGGAIVARDAPLTINASGVMLKDSGLERHQLLCLQDSIHLPDLLTAPGYRGSRSEASAH